MKRLFTLLAMLAMFGMAMAQDINLHRNDDGTWSFTMPARNLVMSTESYSSNDPNGYTIAGVPEGWQVIAAGETVTITDGVTTPITEGTPVTIVPTGNLRRIKSITLVDELPPTTPLDNTSTAWADGSFAVPEGGLTYSDAITVSGNVTLVLTDGETLTMNKGISLAAGATLTVEGTGTMAINGSNENASSTVAGTGTMVLTSGTLTAKGGNGGSVGIYSAYCNGGAGGAAISGDLTINSGTVTSTNGANGQLGPGTTQSSAGAGGKAVVGTVTDNR